MGNCCGTASGNFGGQGRTLEDQDAQPARVSNPSSGHAKKLSAPSPGRKLGNADADASITPKEAAARAAEARAAAHGSSKGALGQRLNQQKQQSQTATLAQGARENLAARDADAATQARNYN